MIYISNETHCRNISADGAQCCDKFYSDHEEADTKRVALAKGYKCSNNKKLLVRFPSRYTDIIVLFMLHCSRSNIFLDIGHGNTRKITDISCPLLSKTEYQGLSGIHAFTNNDYISSLFWKDRKF